MESAVSWGMTAHAGMSAYRRQYQGGHLGPSRIWPGAVQHSGASPLEFFCGAMRGWEGLALGPRCRGVWRLCWSDGCRLASRTPHQKLTWRFNFYSCSFWGKGTIVLVSNSIKNDYTIFPSTIVRKNPIFLSRDNFVDIPRVISLRVTNLKAEVGHEMTSVPRWSPTLALQQP